MPSTTIATVEKMLESLPEEVQEHVVEHLREYILDLQDKLQWDALFKRTHDKISSLRRLVVPKRKSALAKQSLWTLNGYEVGHFAFVLETLCFPR